MGSEKRVEMIMMLEEKDMRAIYLKQKTGKEEEIRAK